MYHYFIPQHLFSKVFHFWSIKYLMSSHFAFNLFPRNHSIFLRPIAKLLYLQYPLSVILDLPHSSWINQPPVLLRLDQATAWAFMCHFSLVLGSELLHSESSLCWIMRERNRRPKLGLRCFWDVVQSSLYQSSRLRKGEYRVLRLQSYSTMRSEVDSRIDPERFLHRRLLSNLALISEAPS